MTRYITTSGNKCKFCGTEIGSGKEIMTSWPIFQAHTISRGNFLSGLTTESVTTESKGSGLGVRCRKCVHVTTVRNYEEVDSSKNKRRR